MGACKAEPAMVDYQVMVGGAQDEVGACVCLRGQRCQKAENVGRPMWEGNLLGLIGLPLSPFPDKFDNQISTFKTHGAPDVIKTS